MRDEACGSSAGKYSVGSCSLGVAFFIAIGAGAVAILATLLSPLARKKKARSDYVI